MVCKMIDRCTADVLTDPGDDRCGREPAGRFHHRPLTMHPVRCNGMQPGPFEREAPAQEASTAVWLDRILRRPDPRADLPAAVPGGLIPSPPQDACPLSGQRLAEPGQQGGGDLAHGSAVDTPPEDFVGVDSPQPIAGPGCGGRLPCGAGLFAQPQGRRGGPTVPRRLGHATPPGRIGKAQHPVGRLRGQADQPVARLFLHA
jgi:hypothetical protein